MEKHRHLPKKKTLGEWASLIVVVTAALAPHSAQAVGYWTQITNYPGNFGNPGHMILLTDGSVMVQQSGGSNWYSLQPDDHGHYLNGNWSALNSMNDTREYYSSDVLPDGRVFVAGGEYGTGASTAEIFNPTSNGGAGSWVHVNPPLPLFNSNQDQFLDSDSIVLQNGNVLITPVYEYEAPSLIYNPKANFWTNSGSDLSWQDEATWVKLPDNSILTVDINQNAYSNAYNTAERFIPTTDSWVPEHNTPIGDAQGYETGGGFLLADGRAFFLCGSGYTLFYTPSGNANPGSWQQGPRMPQLNTNQLPAVPVAIATNNGVVIYNDYLQLTTEDSPAAMLPSGKIFCQLSRDYAHDPVLFYEFDPSTSSFTAAPCPTNSVPGTIYSTACRKTDATSMLLLPDGTVLYNDLGGLYIYQPDITPPVANGKPAIIDVVQNSDGSYQLTGTQLNGISQGTSYGDDAQMDSNFPLVQFTDSAGNVYFGRTYNWSSTGVMTGNTPVSTDFTLPAALADISQGDGSYSLTVVANGIASDPVPFYGPVWVDFTDGNSFKNGTYLFPYSTLSQGANAVASGGTVALKGPGIDASSGPAVSSETLTISAPMTIISVGGPATVGE